MSPKENEDIIRQEIKGNKILELEEIPLWKIGACLTSDIASHKIYDLRIIIDEPFEIQHILKTADKKKALSAFYRYKKKL